MATITRTDIANCLIENLELTEKEACFLINSFLEGIANSLHKGEGVELRGFGSFRLRDRKARQGRNPSSGESIQVPAKRVVYFKMGNKLRRQMIDG